MNIVTEFNIEDEVFFIQDNQVVSGKVMAIQANVSIKLTNPPTPIVKYYLDGSANTPLLERTLFSSRAELAECIANGTYNDRINDRTANSTNDVE